MADTRRALGAILTPTVVTLGVVSLFTDVAADMVTPYLGLFLTRELGAQTEVLGLLEGAATTLSAVMKWVSGRLADRPGARKPMVFFGYALANLARPLMGLATAPGMVFTIRLIDRVGKGLRTTPRDTLLALSVPPEDRATAFGFHRAMDNLGAVIGPLVAVGVLSRWPGDLRRVFLAASIPGAVALLVLALGVREAPASEAKATPEGPVEARASRPPRVIYSRAFQEYLWLDAVFTLGDASDTFVMLRATDLGVPLTQLPLYWGALSLLRALTTTPGGRLADTIGRARAIQYGRAAYALAWLLFGLATRPWHLAPAIACYGVYYGLTEGTERAMIASLSPKESLGRGFGRYHLVLGLLTLPASLLFGRLYRVDHGRTAFIAAAAMALIASLGLSQWRRRHEPAG